MRKQHTPTRIDRPLLPTQLRPRVVQIDTHVRHDQFLVRPVVCPSLDRLRIQYDRRRLLHAEKGDRLEFRVNPILPLAFNHQTALAGREIQDAVRAGRVTVSVVHVGVPQRCTRRVQRHEKRVRSLARLINRVGRFLVQKQDGTVPDVDVDVTNRCTQSGICTGIGLDDRMGPPITPNDRTSAGEYTCSTINLYFMAGLGQVGTHRQLWLSRGSTQG